MKIAPQAPRGQTPWPESGADTFAAVASWDVEVCLIGSAMHDSMHGATLTRLLELVQDDDVSNPKAQLAWSVIRSLWADDRQPDPASISAEIKRRGEHGSAEMLARFSQFLADAFTTVPLVSNAPEYARGVLDDAYRRGMTMLGERLIQRAEIGDRHDLDDALSEGLAPLRELRSRIERADQVHLS